MNMGSLACKYICTFSCFQMAANCKQHFNLLSHFLFLILLCNRFLVQSLHRLVRFYLQRWYFYSTCDRSVDRLKQEILLVVSKFFVFFCSSKIINDDLLLATHSIESTRLAFGFISLTIEIFCNSPHRFNEKICAWLRRESGKKGKDTTRYYGCQFYIVDGKKPNSTNHEIEAIVQFFG